MVREMLGFNDSFEKLSELLKPVAEKLNTKIWVCEKIGKRLSCIARAGNEEYTESFIVYENGHYIVFAERMIDGIEVVEIENFIKTYLS